MAKSSWILWGMALAGWGLYSCWHFGYQAGYAEGHETAWKLYQPYPIIQAAAIESAQTNQTFSDPRR